MGLTKLNNYAFMNECRSAIETEVTSLDHSPTALVSKQKLQI